MASPAAARRGRAFLEREHDDRRQFRFIVSAEDGVERETTRDLIKQMEADLDTRLAKLEIDPLHADTVRLIYRLTLEVTGYPVP